MRDDAPTIAVSTGFTDYGDYLGVALSRPLLRAGALPLVLPYLEDDAARAAALDRVDGLLLGFGRDIAPERYGAGPHPALTATSEHRDASEIALVHEALARDVPLLGICRGMQIVDVALGGTLYRDRSEYPAAARAHPGGDWERWDRVCAATLGAGPMPEHPSHPISVAPGSRLHAALGERAVVNSYHHQAIATLGDGVDAVAWSDDGMIEAVELPAAAFAVGVQWELQESWQDDPAGLAVFEAFVAAARGDRAVSRPARAAAPRPRRAAPAAPLPGARR
jgi:gamma-glutamyl-gamma-aminobutyrate hydrolase PuuD